MIRKGVGFSNTIYYYIDEHSKIVNNLKELDLIYDYDTSQYKESIFVSKNDLPTWVKKTKNIYERCEWQRFNNQVDLLDECDCYHRENDLPCKILHELYYPHGERIVIDYGINIIYKKFNVIYKYNGYASIYIDENLNYNRFYIHVCGNVKNIY